MKRITIIFFFLSLVLAGVAQQKSYSVQIPRELSLDWMLLHPLGYLPSYNIPKATVKAMGTTPDSNGKNVWQNFEPKDDGARAELTNMNFYVVNGGYTRSISVSCSFSESGNYIKLWHYVIWFNDVKSAKMFEKYTKKRMKELGYWKEDGLYVISFNQLNLPHSVDISRDEDFVFVFVK